MGGAGRSPKPGNTIKGSLAPLGSESHVILPPLLLRVGGYIRRCPGLFPGSAFCVHVLHVCCPTQVKSLYFFNFSELISTSVP